MRPIDIMYITKDCILQIYEDYNGNKSRNK